MIIKAKSRRNATGRSRSHDRNKTTPTPLISSGKHLGKPFADVPLSYLRWMIREKCRGWKHATAEIERRDG